MGQVMNELSTAIPATSHCNNSVQIRKWHTFLKMSYHHLLEFVKITMQLNGRDIDGEGSPAPA